MSGYSIDALIDDLKTCYGAKASREAIGLMLAARQRGMMKQHDIFAQAAIRLCRHQTVDH
jgi:hypothetical protein